MHIKISPSTLKRIRRLVTTLFGAPPANNGPDTDPYAGVREPKKRSPGGRSSAVAVEEPNE